AENLQKEFSKSVQQKEIKNDLRKLTSELSIHSSYFRNFNYKVYKSVENYLFKHDYCVFERITPLLRLRYNRGAANEITKYFNNFARCIIYKGNPYEYKKQNFIFTKIFDNNRDLLKVISNCKTLVLAAFKSSKKSFRNSIN
ncbi:43011_t:CDS:2, partial [Gigaspora margarita]